MNAPCSSNAVVSSSTGLPPAWLLTLLLAGLAGLGPFSIDAYLPAFEGIAADLNAPLVYMQQTLAAYLLGFGFMNLFHGAISDAVGRKPVILVGVTGFVLASLACVWVQSIEWFIALRVVQGLCVGAGVVIGRAIIRDLYPPVQAQQAMARVTIVFGVAPAIAPMLGGWLYVTLGWHSIFGLLAAFGLALVVLVAVYLPETLALKDRQSLKLGHLMRGYRQLLGSRSFMLLCLSSGVPFNGMFIYVLSAPAFLGSTLGLKPDQYFWFFMLAVGGIMLGAVVSSHLAHRLAAHRQILLGFLLMGGSAMVGLIFSYALQPSFFLTVIPIALFAMGWSVMMPSVMILTLDLFPQRRGMASSLQAVLASLANGLVAGLISPWVMDSMTGLAWSAVAMWFIGALAWAVFVTTRSRAPV